MCVERPEIAFRRRALWRPALYVVWFVDVILRAYRAGYLGFQLPSVTGSLATSWVILSFVQTLSIILTLVSVVWEWGDCVWLARHTKGVHSFNSLNPRDARQMLYASYNHEFADMFSIRKFLYIGALLLDLGCGAVELAFFETQVWQIVVLFGTASGMYVAVMVAVDIKMRRRSFRPAVPSEQTVTVCDRTTGHMGGRVPDGRSDKHPPPRTVVARTVFVTEACGNL